MFYDLSRYDLYINVPQSDRRYWAFSFYDCDKPRKCTLRYSKGTVSFGVRTHQETAQIDSSTPHGILLTRINLLDQEADKVKVNAFQDEIKPTEESRKEVFLGPNELLVANDLDRYSLDVGYMIPYIFVGVFPPKFSRDKLVVVNLVVGWA
ncbi:hypothetical protein HRR83_005799 [Exophiala dermatitidis]|uniref:DUF1254 domain-containing protein n=1 Tax=Exophiala dermatitidis TaxID=5970 RepID=A0AAN6IUY4_EXODE|nr:hypothetical protein HRR73_007374 [Exophiala dermatitidis]KAJ4510956.1 hypothetical protein HRR75_005650 [Exophiala dermatitidis]KAJ4513355.1 hypothetical protein HRR74_006167 [Exophiala dermatitidis]KAJ4538093.1 hypothetical protein HRR77_007133 [Exophiala dermatitidis]KAJ4539826.1 hypothetical protein HRR76_003260 [Exophiala dermatitidis]